MADKLYRDGGCKEAVCVDAGRVYDSCCDKDCVENMRLFFTEREQMLVDRLKNGPVLQDFLAAEKGMNTCEIMQLITMLTMKGVVETDSEGMVSLK